MLVQTIKITSGRKQISSRPPGRKSKGGRHVQLVPTFHLNELQEFTVTAVAAGHSVEEGKQTPHAGRARVSYSAALQHTLDSRVGFRCCNSSRHRRRVGRQATRAPVTPTQKNKDMDRYQIWPVGRVEWQNNNKQGKKRKEKNPAPPKKTNLTSLEETTDLSKTTAASLKPA